MNRIQMIENLKNKPKWDLIIIGGGATGLGIALDSAARGYKTLLLEKGDFAQETSSKSTKLIHGGVRYLRNRDFSLIRDALLERSLLIKNAPHLVHSLAFILPTQNFWKRFYYYAGLKLYDFFARGLHWEKSKLLSQKEAQYLLPTVQKEQVKGGVKYYDGQFDDSRLAINIAQTFVEKGGTLLNYMPVEALIKKDHAVVGVVARDKETNQKYEIFGNSVINATGAFIDHIRKMDESASPSLVMPSQGAHIILKKEFFPSDQALIVPETSDGRVLFIIPWKDHVLVGTTETPLKQVVEEPKPFKEEIEYILNYASQYLVKAPTKADVLSAFAGIRPLVNIHGKEKRSSSLSRDHLIMISDSKLVTVAGGKWTTYRKIGMDTVDQVIKWLHLPSIPCKTSFLPIHGSSKPTNNEWSYYGSDEILVNQLAEGDSQKLLKLHPELPCRPVDVIWGVRHEMARTVADVLSRRTRCLLLGAEASLLIAPQVAHIMALELRYNLEWEQKEVENYKQLAKRYSMNDSPNE
jgi:glycerol-3-phosphate dehydrogenase